MPSDNFVSKGLNIFNLCDTIKSKKMLEKKEVRFFAIKNRPLVREEALDTSSNNILEIIAFIKKTDPDQPLKLFDGSIVNYINLSKELNEDLSQTILYHGDSSWILTRMEREI